MGDIKHRVAAPTLIIEVWQARRSGRSRCRNKPNLGDGFGQMVKPVRCRKAVNGWIYKHGMKKRRHLQTDARSCQTSLDHFSSKT